MTKLILVRHGETNKNSGNKTHSYPDLESLNSKGEDQIKKAALKINPFLPADIYSSSEKRAIESATIISTTLGVPVRIIKGLEERNWGELSGRPWSDIKEILDSMTLEERYNYIPPMGESWKDFERRLKMTVSILETKTTDKNIVVVTHGGTIRALIPILLNVPKEESFKYDPENASISIFEMTGKNHYKDITINDISHLS